MKRNLVLLNVALVVLLAAGLLEFRRQVQRANARYQIFEKLAGAKEAPPYPAPEPPKRVRPADYMPTVQRHLFYQDRNPDVVVEAPVVEEVKRPDLPLLVGVMDLGEGPIALMAADAKSAPRSVAVGEKVGEFTFLGASQSRISLEWQGEKIEVSQSRLAGRPVAKSATRASAPSSGAARRSAAAATASAAALPGSDNSTVGGKHKIGKEIRPGVHAADPGDTAPDGTEFKGYVKVVRRTPFGSQSWWKKTETKAGDEK